MISDILLIADRTFQKRMFKELEGVLFETLLSLAAVTFLQALCESSCMQCSEENLRDGYFPAVAQSN